MGCGPGTSASEAADGARYRRKRRVHRAIETCKLCEVEPHVYLGGVLTKIVNGHPNSQIDDLLPWAYPTAPALKAVAWKRRLLNTIVI